MSLGVTKSERVGISLFVLAQKRRWKQLAARASYPASEIPARSAHMGWQSNYYPKVRPMSAQNPDTGEGVAPGSHHYRAFIGATQTYMTFSLICNFP
jgi:hypothetical protein